MSTRNTFCRAYAATEMAKKGNRFEAAGSATGYLYQCRFALHLGLQATQESPHAEISIEKFDDVAFETDSDPFKLVQTKHHIEKAGSLTDASVDLWKTLRVWSECVARDVGAPFKTRFVLITTGTAPPSSAASLLRARGRDEEKAHAQLVKVAKSSNNIGNKKCYVAFLALPEEVRLSLLRAVFVLDGSPNIVDIYDEICQFLRPAVAREHLDAFAERLEGWWFGAVIAAIGGAAPIPVSAIENKIDELHECFRRDALPIDYADETPPASVISELDKRPFVRQLRLIEIGPKRIEFAIRDFYRASEQRSKWARERLLVDDEIDRYEGQLIEAWEPRFEAAKDELEDGCPSTARVAAGQILFRWAETDADIPLRTVRARFLTHGSFHILANQQRIGWHPDYQEYKDSENPDES